MNFQHRNGPAEFMAQSFAGSRSCASPHCLCFQFVPIYRERSHAIVMNYRVLIPRLTVKG